MNDKELESLILELKSILDEVYMLDPRWKERGGWPEGESGSVLYPPAFPPEIEAFEKRIGQQLPPSYRNFLKLHNGWDHFWLDFTLTGASGEHTRKVAEKLEEYKQLYTNYLQHDLKLGELTPEKLKQWETDDNTNLFLPNHLPIGTNFGGAVYVFDVRTRKADGEMEICYWTLSSGAWEDRRYVDFNDLLRRVAIDAKSYLAKTRRQAKKRK